MTFVRRLTWASDRSRWKGVGATRSTGSAARTCQWPPSGSLKADRTDPPSLSISPRSCSTEAGLEVAATSAAVSPRDASLAFFLRGGIFVCRRGYIVTAHGTRETGLADLLRGRPGGAPQDPAPHPDNAVAPLRAARRGRRRRDHGLGQAREPQPD